MSISYLQSRLKLTLETVKARGYEGATGSIGIHVDRVSVSVTHYADEHEDNIYANATSEDLDKAIERVLEKFPTDPDLHRLNHRLSNAIEFAKKKGLDHPEFSSIAVVLERLQKNNSLASPAPSEAHDEEPF